MEKSFKFRIYPDHLQEMLINKTFGCCRFAYNYFLAESKSRWETKREIYSYFDWHKDAV